jgi:hypothetical protein
MPVRRLILGVSCATVLMLSVLALVGSDALGWWGQSGLALAGTFIVAAFAPAYFGVDRDSHRRR